MEFFDVGAVVYLLRKVVWLVPGFTVDRFRDRLRQPHDRIAADGPFVAYSARTLAETRKPPRACHTGTAPARRSWRIRRWLTT